MTTTAEQIKQARISAGYSKLRLAADLGITRSAIFQWERGDHKPTPANSRKLEALLGLAPGSIRA